MLWTYLTLGMTLVALVAIAVTPRKYASYRTPLVSLAITLGGTFLALMGSLELSRHLAETEEQERVEASAEVVLMHLMRFDRLARADSGQITRTAAQLLPAIQRLRALPESSSVLTSHTMGALDLCAFYADRYIRTDSDRNRQALTSHLKNTSIVLALNLARVRGLRWASTCALHDAECRQRVEQYVESLDSAEDRRAPGATRQGGR